MSFSAARAASKSGASSAVASGGAGHSAKTDVADRLIKLAATQTARLGRPGSGSLCKHRLLHGFHGDIGRCIRDMGKGRDHFAQKFPIFRHVAGPHLEQIIEIPGNHMRLLDLGHLGDRLVEGGQRRLAGVAQTHLHESHMIEPEADRVQKSAVADDDTGLLQPAQPRLCRGFRQADTFGEIGDADPAIAGQFGQNRLIESVERLMVGFTASVGKFHALPRTDNHIR